MALLGGAPDAALWRGQRRIFRPKGKCSLRKNQMSKKVGSGLFDSMIPFDKI